MRLRFKNSYLVGITAGFIIIISSIFFLGGSRFLFAGVLFGFVISTAQFWYDFFKELRDQKEYESRFLEFVRNLVSAIKSGMPVSKAIILSAKTDYGPLTSHIKKLSYQVEWSIPVHKALLNFGRETGNMVIQRAILTVIEAEEVGGNLEDVLEKITDSLLTIKKIRETRRSSVQAQTMQSYIIFMVFLGVMIVIQNLLVPYMMSINTGAVADTGLFLGGTGESVAVTTKVDIDTSSFVSFVLSIEKWFVSMNGIFLMLTMIQAFFAGIVVGKLGEGDLKSGLRHSFILMGISFLIMSIAVG